VDRSHPDAAKIEGLLASDADLSREIAAALGSIHAGSDASLVAPAQIGKSGRPTLTFHEGRLTASTA
jgi:hypothetical protein